MGLRIVQVDAFTGTPYAGNPAAVCVLPAARDERWMQAVAREMNLSETAFLTRENDGYWLRWFTPAVEVDLCGHATLASAHVLWEDGHLAAGSAARFHTRSGLLTAEHDGRLIRMDFPAEPATPADRAPGLLRALGLRGKSTGRDDVRSEFVGRNRMDYIVALESEQVVRALRPDFTALRQVPARGVIVTAPSARAEYDFVSRFFAPAAGVDEDPVTGSAHCCLAPHWAAKLGKDELVGYQASARGGIVHVALRGNRVILGGEAVTVLRSELVDEPGGRPGTV